MKVFESSKPIFDLQRKAHLKFVSKFSNKREFIYQFRKEFPSVRAYHATNLSEKEIANVERNGLKIPDRELLKNKALTRFSRPEDPELLTTSIAMMTDEYLNSGDYFLEQEIFFGLLKAPLIKESYHYLLLGSEYLLPLADRLSKIHFISFRQRMRDTGKHCIIEATIPLNLVRNIWIESIYCYVNEGCYEANLILKRSLKPKYFKVKIIKRPFDSIGYATI